MFMLKTILICIASIAAASARVEDVPSSSTKLKKLCSEELTQAYVLACMGASQMLGKRSLMPIPVLNALTMDDNSLEAEQADWPYWPWLDPRHAHNRMVSHPRLGKRFYKGLADECCTKPCYMEELLSYCP